MAKKVLLIEYEPRYLDRIRASLAGKDFELFVAKDGDEGLDAYRKSKPDLVLISSVLPKLRTPDVIKGMQTLGGTPPIVLMMSGYKGKNKRSDAQRVGATSILEKPFTEETFLAEVDAALGGRIPAESGAAGGTETGSGLLSADDIFSDVLSGMEDEPAPPPPPTAGTDPGIQKKLEQTLSGILPAPKRASSTASIPKAEAPPARPAEKPAPRPPAPDVSGTVRVEAMNLKPPAPPTPAPAPAPRAPVKVDSSVDRMLTETLSGLKGGKPAEKPVDKPMKPAMDFGAYEKQERPVADKTERLQQQRPVEPPPSSSRPAAPAPVSRVTPAPPPPKAAAPAPPPPKPAPAPAPKPASAPVATGPGGFGRYQLLEKIAAGGMAEVFKARMRGEEGFEKIVAIKRILPHMADNDDFITMFVDEAKLAAQLTHNNIIHIYDLGKVDAYHYIAMEYVDGKDLRSILKMGQERGYPLPPELALFVASKIANALDYAHRRMGMDGKELNLVHRDVSPQNILISFEGDIKLCDFGIAKAATKVSQTQTGALKGKLQYMSPEQAWGKKIDRRTDIFSLGIVLFEMLTGERLFTGDTDLTILEQVRDARVVAPSTRNAEVPKKVDQIVLKALAKNAQERYQNASEMEKEINAVLYSYQPTPGPADLAIYMHRLLESQPVASDEQIDAAFAQAEAGPMPVEEKKKGKGLVISKKAASEKTGVGPAPAPAPAPAPTPSLEVSAPALSLGTEPPKSRTGLYAGIGVAVLLLGGAVYFMTKKGGGTAGPALPTPAVEQPTAVPATTAATPSTAPAPEPTKILDKAAFDAEVKRLAAEREKQLRGEAGKQPTPAPGKPGVAPTAAPSTVSLNPSKPIQPPKGAEPTAAPVPPTAVPKPTEAPKPTPEPVKVAEAPPKPIEPSAVAPNVTQPANAPVKEGDLVGPGEGVEEPKLVRLGAFSLPPQAKNLARGSNIGAPMIMALITEKGAVAETRVLQASGVKFIDEAAVNALKGAKIEPATKNGVKVKMWKAFRIPIKL